MSDAGAFLVSRMLRESWAEPGAVANQGICPLQSCFEEPGSSHVCPCLQCKGAGHWIRGQTCEHQPRWVRGQSTLLGHGWRGIVDLLALLTCSGCSGCCVEVFGLPRGGEMLFGWVRQSFPTPTLLFFYCLSFCSSFPPLLSLLFSFLHVFCCVNLKGIHGRKATLTPFFSRRHERAPGERMTHWDPGIKQWRDGRARYKESWWFCDTFRLGGIVSIVDHRWSEGQGVEGQVGEDESVFVSLRLLK